MSGILNWYQYLPFYINPIAFKIGSFSVHWYSLGYLVGFVVVYFLLRYRLAKGEWDTTKFSIFNFQFSNKSKIQNPKPNILDLMIYLIIGLLIGGRFGYVVFYNLPYFLHHPLEIILPIQVTGYRLLVTGYYGMSYFGGAIGIILSALIFAKKRKINFWQLADFVVPAIPAGYFFGRIGNFLNGELYGRATGKFWGMYFPVETQNFTSLQLRHPSQLYEAFFEGLILFLILWSLRNFWTPGVQQARKVRDTWCPTGSLLLIYLFLYGLFRFFIEFFRQPDPLPLGSFSAASPQIGMIFNFLTLGQIFSLLAMILAIFLYLYLPKSYPQS